jgi:hypothetical protein
VVGEGVVREVLRGRQPCEIEGGLVEVEAGAREGREVLEVTAGVGLAGERGAQDLTARGAMVFN